jgi:hypothetical protein
MALIDNISNDLGHAYSVKTIDGGGVIYRKLADYEFEVSGIKSTTGKCALYVWKLSPRILVGIYERIPVANLSDILGHYAAKYQNLLDGILVERED